MQQSGGMLSRMHSDEGSARGPKRQRAEEPEDGALLTAFFVGADVTATAIGKTLVTPEQRDELLRVLQGLAAGRQAIITAPDDDSNFALWRSIAAQPREQREVANRILRAMKQVLDER
jgi:hypothetical protein